MAVEPAEGVLRILVRQLELTPGHSQTHPQNVLQRDGSLPVVEVLDGSNLGEELEERQERLPDGVPVEVELAVPDAVQ